MDSTSTLLILVLCLFSAGATFAACQWFYGRRLREATQRMTKLEHDRQTAVQMVQQARRQIEQMQREASAVGKERVAALAARKRVQAMEETLQRGDTQVMPDHPGASRQGGDTQVMGGRPDAAWQGGDTQVMPGRPGFGARDTELLPDRPGLPSNGFADTLPMEQDPNEHRR